MADESIRDKHYYSEQLQKLKDKGFECTITQDGVLLNKCHLNQETIVIPSEITEISSKAFLVEEEINESLRIKKIVVPESVKKIADYAFNSIRSLEEINLPKSILIPGRIIVRCPNLKRITGYFKMTHINKVIDFSVISPENPYFNKIDYIFYGIRLRIKKKTNDETNLMYNLSNYFEIYDDNNVKAFMDYIYFEESINSQSYYNILSNIIKSTSSEDIYSKILVNYNEESFKKNVDFFIKMQKNLKSREINFTDQDISVIFINNPSFFKVSIEDTILQNFTYLVNEKIVSEQSLQQIYFNQINKTELATSKVKRGIYLDEILLEVFCNSYISQKTIPKLIGTLAVEPNEKNQLELRDRLIFVSTMGYIGNKEKETALTNMLLRTNFDNISEIDSKTIGTEYEQFFYRQPKFKGMKSILKKKIDGINDSWFNTLCKLIEDDSSNSIFNNFFNSLETVKKWSEFTNEQYRATCLKNEIFGRLLYGVLKRVDPSENLKGEDIKQAIKNADTIFNNRVEMGNILASVTGTKDAVFTSHHHITNLISLDPYSFDALRNNIEQEEVFGSHKDNDLQKKYIKLAAEKGYLLSASTKRKYGIQKANGNKHLWESINNNIGLAKIPNEDRLDYLERVRKYVSDYIAENSEEMLFEILRSTDLYMRSNNEYTNQASDKGEDFIITAKRMFDINNREVSDEDRLLYCMYNLNKLAHNQIGINIEVEFLNDRLDRLTTTKTINGELKVVSRKSIVVEAIKSYNILRKYGIPFKFIESYVSDNTPIANELLNRTYNYPDAQIAVVLSMYSTSPQSITVTDVPIIKESLATIKELDKKELSMLETYAEEYSLFFETKEIIANEMIRRTVIANDFENLISKIIFSSTREKQEYYNEHGYVIEVQKDLSSPSTTNPEYVLVCYSKMFKEPFSIHLPNISDTLKNKISTEMDNGRIKNTLVHTKLESAGLTLSSKKVTSLSNGNYKLKQRNSKLIAPLYKGFYSQPATENEIAKLQQRTKRYDSETDIDYSVELENYITYDLYPILYPIKKKIESLVHSLDKEDITPEELNDIKNKIRFYFENDKLPRQVFSNLFELFPELTKNTKLIIIDIKRDSNGFDILDSNGKPIIEPQGEISLIDYLKEKMSITPEYHRILQEKLRQTIERVKVESKTQPSGPKH